MSKLEIKNLHAGIKDKEILKGINLEINLGEVHALMGPNGAGKSCLASVLMGDPKYTITSGQILLDGKDITNLGPTEKAKLGLFLSFQYPSEIPGVSLSNFLRTAYNTLNNKKLGVVEFHELLREKMKDLGVLPSFSKRYLNQGFSGGEKKRAEILQMSVLNPKYTILDECDSGLDVDSLKIIGEGINKIHGKDKGILIITHYYRILKYLSPDRVSILVNGKIIKTGSHNLALDIEKEGFDKYLTKTLSSNPEIKPQEFLKSR